ncbi:MAG: CHAT domain-containing protein [Pseudomonadota bacterium]
MKRLSESDIVRNPRPVLAELPALIAQAGRDPRVPFAEIAAARHILAYARTYDGDHAGGIAELDALVAELKRRGIGGTLYLETLRRKGTILSAQKRLDDAAAIYLIILAEVDRAGAAPSGVLAETLNGLAVVRARQGKYEASEALARRATAVGRVAPDIKPLAVGDAWRTWVVLLGLTGKSGEALIEAQKSLKYNELNQPEGSESTVGAMNSLSSMLSDVGRYADAEAIQRRLIAVEQRQTTTQVQTMALYLANFGSTLLLQGKAAEAEAVLRQARDLMLKVKHQQRPDFLGIMTGSLGKAVHAQGRDDEALALYREAVDILARDAGIDHPAWAQAHSDVARMLLDRGDPAGALEQLDRARPVIEKRLDPADPARLLADLLTGEARVRRGDPGGYALAKRAIDADRAVLVNAAIDPLRSALMARERSGSFTRFARLALERGEVADAFVAVQLAQFGDLDSAGAGWLVRQQAATPKLAALVAEMQTTAARLKSLQGARIKAVVAADAVALTDADRQIEAAKARSGELNARLTIEFPAYAKLVRPEPRALQDVQTALRPGQALVVSTPTGTGDVIALLITAAKAEGVAVTLPRGALNLWTRQLRESIDQARDGSPAATYDAAAAYALFNAILPPALDRQARRADHLLVQAGGVLASVPVAALLTAKPRTPMFSGAALRTAPWLVRRQAVSRPVSLATLGAGQPPRDAVRFAAVGAPTLAAAAVSGAKPKAVAALVRSSAGMSYVSELPSLPAAEQELRAIASALGERSPLMLVGASATKANLFAQDLRPYTVIAFATHGLVSGELRNLTEPALVLTPSGTLAGGDDGLLTASEVARLQLNADWVILSACNTSAGEGGAAPIYTGLARAFVQAGARSLLLSHWPLRDDVAANLTVQTVRAAAGGLSKAAALRQAQLKLIADRQIDGAAHPALWAPLALIGD